MSCSYSFRLLEGIHTHRKKKKKEDRYKAWRGSSTFPVGWRLTSLSSPSFHVSNSWPIPLLSRWYLRLSSPDGKRRHGREIPSKCTYVIHNTDAFNARKTRSPLALELLFSSKALPQRLLLAPLTKRQKSGFSCLCAGLGGRSDADELSGHPIQTQSSPRLPSSLGKPAAIPYNNQRQDISPTCSLVPRARQQGKQTRFKAAISAAQGNHSKD